MSEKTNSLRVFIDSNVLISAMQSSASVSRKLLLVLAEEHFLLICSYSIVEVTRVIRKRFPAKITEWEHFLSLLDFEMVYTPENPRSFPAPYISQLSHRKTAPKVLISLA